jgi:hypothetical protein
MISFAAAMWNQRQALLESRERLKTLHALVDSPADFSFHQWTGLFALCMEFAPDLIIELGRRYGNSTCIFTEAANRLGPTRVVSLCLTRKWQTRTVPCLEQAVPREWFDPLRAMTRNLLKTDFGPILADSQKVLLFWDAHGADVAAYVLGKLFPLLQARTHLVVVHDVTDTRYNQASPSEFYDNRGMYWWWMGHLLSAEEELVSLYDFLSRNRIVIHTPNESLQRELPPDSERFKQLRASLGDCIADPCSYAGHWIYFNMDERVDLAQQLAFPLRQSSWRKLLTRFVQRLP